MTQPPHDHPVMVLTKEEGLWVPVLWDGVCFAVINGDGSWVEPDEVEDWRTPMEMTLRATEQVAA